MKKILVTGGCGYIGSHTIIDLLDNGFDVVSVDNFLRSSADTIDRIAKISGKRIKNYTIDLCNLAAIEKVFQEEKIDGIIHFAALKSVPESVENPLLYYHNNLESLNNILALIEKYAIQNFVFSSSCSVYGNVEQLPVTEESPLAIAESPYAHTKQIGEDIIKSVAQNSANNFISLRYFNPVGAHESALNGEVPIDGKVYNIIPRITRTALGIYPVFEAFGFDYPTRDGTCIRDYIHVMDIANAHTKALQYLIQHKSENNYEVFNLGTGNGVTVLEAIHSFEKASGKKLNYKLSDRRAGDVVAIYANNTKAKDRLGWNIQRDLDEMMRTAWEWDKSFLQQQNK